MAEIRAGTSLQDTDTFLVFLVLHQTRNRFCMASEYIMLFATESNKKLPKAVMPLGVFTFY